MAQYQQSLDAKATIAVAGATGDLGTRLIHGFLDVDLRGGSAGLIALVRKESDKTQEWEKQGVEVRTIDGSSSQQDLVGALDGVDVLVNALPTSGAALRDNIARALPKTALKVYFPSEFGVDHRLHDFNIPEWDGKRAHYDLVQKTLRENNNFGIIVCRLFVGLFLHSGISAAYGFDTAKSVYEAVGSLDQIMNYTDTSDVAKVVVDLSTRVVRGMKIPQDLRIAGTHASFRDIASIMGKAGAENVELRSVDLQEFRERALARKYEDRDAVECLRFIMGDGRDDYRDVKEGGLGNDNVMVNGDERVFKWKTLEDLAVESQGRPNADP
ncbi:uncharacterized protein AB675_7163 [Cyphellophora attinorum]|uniref:NmrA-like domain-containing protein n=1 Tax=Cyphellophora attinorum TaxID=1664694 RepID=A0A0N0NQ31_9EURO|nr:uncharacterized protein AB675_7163 [Phialophora attinorum]KPI43229.1 hypothetical protein AB675_7163 [Phialophora attinorum]